MVPWYWGMILLYLSDQGTINMKNVNLIFKELNIDTKLAVIDWLNFHTLHRKQKTSVWCFHSLDPLKLAQNRFPC